MSRSTYHKNGLEQRMNCDLREAIQKYLDDGWKIISRDPITIERGRRRMYLENGVFKYI